MYKNFMAVFMAITILFMTQSQVWASAKPVVSENQTNYTIDKNFFFITEKGEYEFARNNLRKPQPQNIAWIGSIFFMGLGQWLMGDFWRGFQFYVWSALVVLAGIILTLIIIGPFLIGPGLLAIYIWNIIDAYNMSLEEDLLEAGNAEKLAIIEAKINEFLKVAGRMTASDKKVNFELYSF